MAEHVNFYENLQEALMRLRGTVVLYDKEPQYVWTITDHKPDGKFRVYLSPLPDVNKGVIPTPMHQHQHGLPQMGPAMDAWMEGDGKHSGITVIRKNMDSPLFNKFRPFPLGMMNQGSAYYVQRRPNRPKTEQGLIANAVDAFELSASPMKSKSVLISLFTEEFRDCILGDYPTPKECLEGLKGDNINESVAFHRNFALVRGPIDTLFLAYKDEIVGALPRTDFSSLRLGRKFKHLKEAVHDLRLFSVID